MYDDTRSDWNAETPKSRYTVSITTRTEFFSHWNGGPIVINETDPHSKCLAKVKAIQYDHMHLSHDWDDIGYNALVCVHGRLIEGRGRDVVGAHCTGHNRSGIGVQFMRGTGQVTSDKMLNRARKFYDECVTAAKRPLRKMGHNDGMVTDCPGKQISDWVDAGMPLKTMWEPVVWSRDDVRSILTVLDGGEWGTNTDMRIHSVRAVAYDPITPSETQVKYVQGLLGVNRTGIVDSATRTALPELVKKFQYKFGVSRTGVWGATTEREFQRLRSIWLGK